MKDRGTSSEATENMEVVQPDRIIHVQPTSVKMNTALLLLLMSLTHRIS
jgi:hypothetical protein